MIHILSRPVRQDPADDSAEVLFDVGSLLDDDRDAFVGGDPDIGIVLDDAYQRSVKDLRYNVDVREQAFVHQIHVHLVEDEARVIDAVLLQITLCDVGVSDSGDLRLCNDDRLVGRSHGDIQHIAGACRQSMMM